jgi:lysosomal alpha-mannosidase
VVLGEKSLAAIERDIAQRKMLLPWVFITDQDVSGRLQNLQFSNMKSPLDDNVQILTLEPWKDGILLVRLEHVLEKDEDANLSKEVTVDLSVSLNFFCLNAIREVQLFA